VGALDEDCLFFSAFVHGLSWTCKLSDGWQVLFIAY